MTDAPRSATVTRTTKETDVRVELDARRRRHVGRRHRDAVLRSHAPAARQARGFDLSVSCDGDLAVDGHHTVEDCGLAVGQALKEALGDKAGVRRFASIVVPLDEAAVEVALDLSGRTFVVYDVPGAGRDDRHVRHGPGRGLRACVRPGRGADRPRPPAERPVAAPRRRGGVQGAREALRDACSLTGPAGVPSTKGTL